MDHIFRDLKEAKASSSGKISTVDYLDLATESGTQFVLNSHPDLPTDMVQTFKEQASKSNAFYKNYLSAKSSNDQESYEILLDSLNPHLSENQKLYIDKIFSTLTSGIDIDPMLAAFDEISDEAKTNCTDNEISVILAALSVAKHSAQYWHDHLGEWESEFRVTPSSNGRIQGDIRWGVVAGADVATAATVAGSMWGFSLIPGVGWALPQLLSGDPPS